MISHTRNVKTDKDLAFRGRLMKKRACVRPTVYVKNKDKSDSTAGGLKVVVATQQVPVRPSVRPIQCSVADECNAQASMTDCSAAWFMRSHRLATEKHRDKMRGCWHLYNRALSGHQSPAGRRCIVIAADHSAV